MNIGKKENGRQWMMMKKPHIEIGICILPTEFKKNTVIHVLSMKYDAGKKLEILDKAFEYNDKKKMRSYQFLPKLAGDKCTFIGSTFLNLGEREPYYNNMIVLGECSDTPEVPDSEIVWKRKENVLLEWTKLIQKEDPDIIIGYNIFGFDWKFLLERAKELKVLDKFLVLGRNKKEKCEIKETTTTVASGTYELVYVKFPVEFKLTFIIISEKMKIFQPINLIMLHLISLEIVCMIIQIKKINVL